jgi:hypothetical protein
LRGYRKWTRYRIFKYGIDPVWACVEAVRMENTTANSLLTGGAVLLTHKAANAYMVNVKRRHARQGAWQRFDNNNPSDAERRGAIAQVVRPQALLLLP